MTVVDYVFLPAGWIGKVHQLSIGSFEAWCGAGLSLKPEVK